MENKLNDALTAYDAATGAIASPPEWFVETMRSQGTRNITVDTWNTLCTNVRRLASNGAAADELIKVFGDLLKDIVEHVKATKSASKMPVKYDSDNLLFESVDGTERVVVPSRIPSNVINTVSVLSPQYFDSSKFQPTYYITQLTYESYGARIHFNCNYVGCLSSSYTISLYAGNWNLVADKTIGDNEPYYPTVFTNVSTCTDRTSGSVSGLPNDIDVDFNPDTGTLKLSTSEGYDIADYSYGIDIEIVDSMPYHNSRSIYVKVIQYSHGG